MQAVISLLGERYNNQVEALWRKLENECGLNGISLMPLPHFSWHVAEAYDDSLIKTELKDLTHGKGPLIVRTTGLGLFTGPSPVIYIPVVKDAALAAYHQAIWEHIQPLANQPLPFYSPDAWVPHITLAYGDVNPKTLNCALQQLAFQNFSWEFQVDHLALAYQISGQTGKLLSQFPFQP
jgi:2'-5' RNA ligase